MSSSRPSPPTFPLPDAAESPGPAFRPLGPAGAAPLLEKARTTARSGVLEVRGDGESAARITVRAGQVVEARAGAVQGREAVLRIFLWPTARYRWVDETPGEPSSPELATDALVTEGLRRRAVWQLMLRELPPLSARYVVDFHRLSLRLEDLPVVARDLCRLFDGRRSVGEVFADAALPELETASIVGYLLGAGILADAEANDPASVARLQAAPTRQNLPAAPAADASAPLNEQTFLPLATDADPGNDETPVVGALEQIEQTDVIVVTAPPPQRPVRLVTMGLALGVGLALVLGLARLPRPRPSAPPPPAAKAIPAPAPTKSSGTAQRVTITSGSEAPPVVLAPPAGDRERALCLRSPDQDLPKRVVAACEQALSAAGPQADVLSVLARAALEQGQFARAADRARQAVALDPALAEAYAYLGFAEAERGRRAAALAAYRRYLALAPNGRLAQDIRAIVAR